MITGTQTTTVAALLGVGFAVAAVWAFAAAALPPGQPAQPAAVAGDPPVGPPDPRAQVARVGSPEFRHPRYASLLGTSADGKWLYTAEAAPLNHGDAHLYIWDTTTGRLQAKHHLGSGSNAISAIGFGPDGVRVFEWDRRGQYRLRIVNPDTGKTSKTGERWAMRLRIKLTGGGLNWYHHSKDAAWMIRSAPKGYSLFNTTTGKETLIDLQKEGASPTSSSGFFVSRDGRVFCAHDETGIRLHQLPSGKHLGNVPDVGNPQHPAGFTPDGKHLLLWVRRAEVYSLHAYDIESKKRRTVLDKRSQPGRVYFAADGKRFALVPTASFGSLSPVGDWEVRDFATGKELGRVPATGYAGGVLLGPDGRTLYTKPGENMVVPWDVATGKPTAAAPRVLGTVERFRFTPDGKLVGLAGGFVYTWDAKKKEMARERVPRPIDGYGAATFNPAGDRLHFTGVGDKLVAWNFRTGAVQESALELKRAKGERVEHWFTPDGSRHVEYRSSDRLLLLRDPTTGKETARISVPVQWGRHNGWPPVVFGLALSPDGRRVAIGGDNTHDRPDPSGKLPPSLVGVLSMAGSGEPVAGEAAGRVSAVAFSPDGRFLVGTFRENPIPELGVWNSHTGRRVATVALGREQTWVNALRFSPDGRALAVSLGQHEVRLVETACWQVRATVTTRTRESNVYLGYDRTRDLVAWSPDGRRLATAALDGGLTIWDVRKLGTAKPLADAAAVDRAWAAITGDDAPAALAAIRALGEAPERAFPVLKSKVPPVPAPAAAKLKAMIAALDSERFAERERATADLAKLGQLAEPALRAALRTTTSAEVTWRVGWLLAKLDSAILTEEDLVAVRAVEVAERAGTPDAVKLLETWASGADGARLTADAKAALARIKKQ